MLGRTEDEAREKGLKLLDRVGLIAHKDKFPGPALRRPAAARGDRARAVDGPDRDAVRRADLGARPGDDQRGARRDGRAGQGRHDHDGGHPRDGLRAQGRATRDLHGPGADRRGLPEGRFLRQAALRARPAVPVENPAPLM